MKKIIETKVVNLRKEKYDIYIGRGSRWGNPFKIGIDGTRYEVIEKYREYIENIKSMILDLCFLRGEILGCYCKPKDCHGTILLQLISDKYGDKLIDNFTLIGGD